MKVLKITLAIVVYFLLSVCCVNGQGSVDWVIEGKVLAGNESSAGVAVQIKGLEFSTITDKDGSFILKGSATGAYHLQFHCIGCQDWDSIINLQPGSRIQLTIALNKEYKEISQVQIFGSKADAMRNLPGAATLITPLQIKQIQPVSANEVLRKAPGVHAVDEEGLGLRPNIGIRGLDPDRSRYVLVLEDGVPVSLSPYGEPEMYYSPSIDRMQQVEILKGSSSIQYGPRTIAGVVNYRTADPSAKPEGTLQLMGGDNGYFSALLGYGTTIGNTGVQINYLRKQTDDFGMLRLRLNDLSAKFRWMISSKEVVGFKLGVYDEFSNANYIGMTQSMYLSGQNDITRLAPEDQFHIRRYSASLTYSYILSERFRLEVLGFAYTTQRNWCRQDFAYNSIDTSGNLLPKPADYSGVTWGDESISGGAIYMRNSTGNRNRTFDVAGSEVRTRYAFTIGSIANELLGGVRFMAEKAHEVRINGVFAGDLSGEISDEEYRPVYGYSAFVSDKIALGKQLEITPGIRVEFMQFDREIIRGKYKINNVTTARDTSIENSGSLMQVIPGVGFSYMPVKQVTVFGGVHRGFAPPRIKDAITSDGTDQELSAELSWNYELGIRSVLMKGVRMEITAFLLDFENQVIPVSESSGGTGTGLMNGGGTESKGVEASLSLNTADIRKTKWSSEILVNATYTQASFNGDRFTGTSETKVNINGNKLPYVPEWSGNVLLSVLSPYHLRFNCNLQYTGEQYTDVLNTENPSANGLVGVLPSFYTIDAGLGFDWIKANATITASVKNLTDERYIYTRRPQGIRVGLERMIFIGIKKRF